MGVALLLLAASLSRDRILKGLGDFSQIYAAATLSGSGQIYQPEVFNRRLTDVLAGQMEPMPYIRLPYYAFLLTPLTWLPYRAAFGLFVALNVIALIWFLRRFDPGTRELFVLAAYSVPLYSALANGQETPLLVAVAGGGLLLLRGGRDFGAGVMFSLLTIKYHLFFPLPLLFMKWKMKRTLAGCVLAILLMLGISFLVEGPYWVSDYVKLLRTPSESNPFPGLMPNLHGAAFTLAGPKYSMPVEALLALAVLTLWWIAISKADFEVAFALTVVAGILTSYHSYASDCLLLLVPAALMLRHATGMAWKAAIAIATLPPIYLMLLSNAPSSLAMPAVLVAILVLAAFSSSTSRGYTFA
jgi:glycosyl transferase family 87